MQPLLELQELCASVKVASLSYGSCDLRIAANFVRDAVDRLVHHMFSSSTHPPWIVSPMLIQRRSTLQPDSAAAPVHLHSGQCEGRPGGTPGLWRGQQKLPGLQFSTFSSELFGKLASTAL